MESKWYFFPGQTPENTNISNRAHALHITAKGWNNITQHLYRKQRIQEALDKEKAHRDALKQGSEAMTKKWANSIESLRQRKELERAERMHQKKEDKIQLFYKMREEQEVVRQEYLKKVKKDAFRSTGFPKELTSALILSETLYEREKQQEFNQKLVKHREELQRKFDEEMTATAAREKQEDEDHRRARYNAARKVGDNLKQQIEENEKRKKEETRAHIERETKDRINAEKEEELIKQFEAEEKIRARNEMKVDKIKELQAERLRRELLQKEDAELEKATKFYEEAKSRITCLMKNKEKQMREEATAAREQLAAKVAAVQISKEAEEEARIAKVIAERDAEDEAKLRAKSESQMKAKKERIEDREQFLQRLQKKREVDDELKRWELLNRCKANEAIREHNEQRQKEQWLRMLQYRKELLEQMEDNEEIRKQEKEIDDIMSRVDFEKADKMFFEYADEVMNLARSKRRPTRPIEKIISNYRKVHNLGRTCRHCKCSHGEHK